MAETVDYEAERLRIYEHMIDLETDSDEYEKCQKALQKWEELEMTRFQAEAKANADIMKNENQRLNDVETLKEKRKDRWTRFFLGVGAFLGSAALTVIGVYADETRPLADKVVRFVKNGAPKIKY